LPPAADAHGLTVTNKEKLQFYMTKHLKYNRTYTVDSLDLVIIRFMNLSLYLVSAALLKT